MSAPAEAGRNWLVPRGAAKEEVQGVLAAVAVAQRVAPWSSAEACCEWHAGIDGGEGDDDGTAHHWQTGTSQQQGGGRNKGTLCVVQMVKTSAPKWNSF